MTLRRFAVLVRGLPASARVWAESNGGWTVTDHLLADVWDELARLRSTVWATVSTPPRQKPRIDAPTYPRPRETKTKATKPRRGWASNLARQVVRGGTD